MSCTVTSARDMELHRSACARESGVSSWPDEGDSACVEYGVMRPVMRHGRLCTVSGRLVFAARPSQCVSCSYESLVVSRPLDCGVQC